MGIINTTPDSFFEGSRQQTAEAAVMQAERMLAAGATWLDIGGQSTRPGATMVGAEEETERIVPAIEAIHARFPNALMSIDTFHASVAEAAVMAGASMVNDVSGGQMDAAMLDTVAALQVPYVCMHMRGTPETMQHYAVYENVVQEVLQYFIERMEACRKAGIKDVLLDPGIGFAKTIEHNFQVLHQLEAFQILGAPVLLGVSRKSTIYKTLGISAAEALNGTTVLHTIGLLKGAAILRVHDVKEAVEAVKLVSAMQQSAL
ncbi:MAG TPA: dihydropteroate synthase [Phnomibacter sp.]|nr:dihydropteroate synthase [Phnomibacter sp.]